MPTQKGSVSSRLRGRFAAEGLWSVRDEASTEGAEVCSGVWSAGVRNSFRTARF
ncbi:hypothetical protein RRSWK_07186 [Rhodopirellula sp. SWK7]|nr:hypothetical protein RRSWK_07186 [Rhodopirellula sp. SWK7]